MLLTFIYGIFIYKIYTFLKSRRDGNNPLEYKYILYVFLILVISLLFIKVPGLDGHGVLKWGLLSFFIIVILLVIELIYGLPRFNVLLWLGDISYSLYLTHIIVLEFVFKKIIPYIWNNPNSGFGKLLFYVSISLIFSYFTYVLVEKPFIRYGKELIKKI